jgi:hypothetical protein
MEKEKSSECGCCCGCHEQEETMTGMAIRIADKAWSKVLQRRLESMLEKKRGKTMDKVAAVAMEYATKYYAASMGGKELGKGETDSYEKKLMAAMKG